MNYHYSKQEKHPKSLLPGRQQSLAGFQVSIIQFGEAHSIVVAIRYYLTWYPFPVIIIIIIIITLLFLYTTPPGGEGMEGQNE